MVNRSIIRRIKFRRLSSYLSLLLVASFLLSSVFTGMLGTPQKSKAATTYYLPNNYYITQSDHYLDSTDTTAIDLVIPSGAWANIDGEHRYRNITVQSGGVLTSGDYNRYGVVDPSPGGNLRDGPRPNQYGDNLIGNPAAQYIFIMRGFINVGGVQKYYSPELGHSFSDNGFSSIEFYNSVATATPVSQDMWSNANQIGHAYNNYTGVGSVQYHDLSSSIASPLIPFELRYASVTGESDVGIGYCTAVCNNAANYNYLNVIDIATVFAAAPATPQLKSTEAWQGYLPDDQYFFDSYASYNSYAAFSAVVANHRSMNGYANYYHANGYNFANDKKITLAKNDAILSAPTLVEVGNQNENVTSAPGLYRSLSYLSFYSINSPLGGRYSAYDTPSITPYPILTRSLYNTMEKRIPTKLNLDGTLRVDSGGQINVNGKGFSYGRYAGYGPGPGYGSDIGPSTGASHAGRGGRPGASSVYDADSSVPPALPGSGSAVNDYEYLDPAHYNGYGGGYINIAASKISINYDSMVLANGIGGRPPDGGLHNQVGGASGGAIVLSDSDSTSVYRGLITAVGGQCYFVGGLCQNGGGGGGYVHISTTTNIAALQNREDRNTFPLECDGEGCFYGAAEFFTGDFGIAQWKAISGGSWWTTGLDRPITASGGASERYQYRFGDPGLVVIVGPGITMRKTLEPFSRGDGGSATFNPYALQLGDTITVTLEFTNLPIRSDWYPTTVDVRDHYLIESVSRRKMCAYIPGSFINNMPTNGSTDFSAADGESHIGIRLSDDFWRWRDINMMSVSYRCKVNTVW